MDFRVIECLHSFTKEDVCVLLPNGQGCTFLPSFEPFICFSKERRKSHILLQELISVNAKTRARGGRFICFDVWVSMILSVSLIPHISVQEASAVPA